MSAPSKIAAIRDAVSALHGTADDGADTRRHADALQEAGATVDALIDAVGKLTCTRTDGGMLVSVDSLADVVTALILVKGVAA
ncbi:hypothetical protein PWP89_13130 [Stenotrophomonas rhizophila]|uniref:hypothetical protein n=1 Tax=Stenotrophomonas rhizophila TaxID=216778 RepID=UPI000B8A0F30|nr:hypothetical protein [Stenotrophomonas rhizophila]